MPTADPAPWNESPTRLHVEGRLPWRMLPFRTIWLPDRNSRWSNRPGGAGIESIALEVPGRPSDGIVEATFERSA
jgi:hypothetical protein